MAINRVIIEGNLTRDVEMRATASGLAVAGFTVAVNEKRKNAEGEYVDAPVFVKCSLFGTRAEKLSKYLLKGTKVTIDGKLRYSQWTKDDEKRHELSVIFLLAKMYVESWEMLAAARMTASIRKPQPIANTTGLLSNPRTECPRHRGRVQERAHRRSARACRR